MPRLHYEPKKQAMARNTQDMMECMPDEMTAYIASKIGYCDKNHRGNGHAIAGLEHGGVAVVESLCTTLIFRLMQWADQLAVLCGMPIADAWELILLVVSGDRIPLTKYNSRQIRIADRITGKKQSKKGR